MNIIALEGVDKVGKSSTALALEATTVHWGKPTDCDKPIHDYWRDKLESLNKHPYAQLNQDLMVWDRSFLGNYIYGSFKQDQPTLTLKEVEALVKGVGKMCKRADFFLLRADGLDFTHRYEFANETYINPAEACQLQVNYENLFYELKNCCENVSFHILQKCMPLRRIHESIRELTQPA